MVDRNLIWTPEEKEIAKNIEYWVDELSVKTDGTPTGILSHAATQPHPFAVALLVATSKELVAVKGRLEIAESQISQLTACIFGESVDSKEIDKRIMALRSMNEEE